MAGGHIRAFGALIFGAGPAGSATAALLAERGFNIAVVERSTFPRPNVVVTGIGWVTASGTGIDGLWTGSRSRRSRIRTFATSGTEPYQGHALGTSGAIEAAVCALGMRRGWLPPTVNLDTPDPECDLKFARTAVSTKCLP